MQKRILVIEDEVDIAQLIRLHLDDLGFLVAIAHDGNAGLRKASMGSWDLIVLDLRLPGIDGLEICRRLRQDSGSVPILMLTSKSSELDRVVGLEVGADDYVTKPFSVLELIARVKAILRRAELARGALLNSQREVQVGCLKIDPSTRCATIRREVVSHINRLRAKIEEDPAQPELIVTVWGVGYKMNVVQHNPVGA